MLIRVGYNMAFHFPEPTAMVLMLSLHPSRASTIRQPERLEVKPGVAVSEFIDAFGNRCSRLFVPAGHVMLHNEAIVEDTGQPDPQVWDAPQHKVQDIADDMLRFLLASRYCTGYLGDIGVPPAPYPMDFSAWFEAFLGGQWYAFDPRHNVPRIGRVLVARGRAAADTALTTTFGVHQLASFTVWTDEISEEALRQPRSSS